MVEGTRMADLIKQFYDNILYPNQIADLDIFISDYESYEEIPILNRLYQAKFLESFMDKENISMFLYEFAKFYVDVIISYANKKLSPQELNSFFIAITYIDPEDCISEYGICIPNILVSKKKQLFKKVIDRSMINFPLVFLGSSNDEKYRISISFNTDFKRYYIIPK